jgi:hypothetical protein
MSLDYIGIDIHKLSSQVCILTSDGESLERRIKTDRQSLAQIFAGRTPTRILLTCGAIHQSQSTMRRQLRAAHS